MQTEDQRPQPERRSLSPKEYAHRHGISTRTVHRLIKAGRLHVIRFNARVIRVVPKGLT
jgi:predicted site-specific integrase-resolvase